MILKSRDDTPINVEVSGNGKPIVLLHGGFQDLKSYDRLVHSFPEGYMLIQIDTRGHGKSGYGDFHLTFDVLGKDIEDVIRQLEINQFSIVGFSDGANIALYTAAVLRNQVKSLVLISPNLEIQGLKTPMKVAIALLKLILKPLRSNLLFLHLYDKISLMAHNSVLLRNCVPDVKARVLIISSQFDVIHKSHIIEIAKLIPNSSAIFLKKLGHNMLDQGVIHDIIIQFESENVDH